MFTHFTGLQEVFRNVSRNIGFIYRFFHLCYIFLSVACICFIVAIKIVLADDEM